MKDFWTETTATSGMFVRDTMPRRERAVSDLCEKTEEVFVAAGDHLADTSAALGQTKRVLAVFDEMNANGTLRKLREHGRWHDTEMRTLSEEVFKALEILSALMDRARGVDGQVRTLREILKMMNIVVLNARITVAATVSGTQDAGSNLTGFTEEATRLVDELSTILVGLDEAMQRIKQGSGDALDRARFLGDLLSSSLSGPVAALNTQLADFEAHIETLGTASAEISDKSQSLMMASATAVSGLQIGDTTRQRLEHVLHILEHVPAAGDETDALNALAAHQMDDIATLHVEGVDAVREGASTFETGIMSLVRDHLMIFEQRNGSQRLKTGLVEIETRIAQALETQGVLMEFARSLSQEFEALTGIISAGEAFEARMRMIGINAVIACARLGQRGLALREIAGQLQELARDASARLPEVGTELAEMMELAGETIALLETACDRANALPEGAVRQLSDGVRDVGDAAVRSSEIVSDIKAKLGSSKGWLAPLEDHAQMIRKTARIFSHDQGQDSFEGTDSDIAASVFEVYTMERERDIHRKVIVVKKPMTEDGAPIEETTPAPAPAAAPAEDSLDDIFF
ncbi:hypothetical protein [Marivita sp.]|uniref:hypothetical protein n=1 Tax=Marivita sp. TaxID=2003365 RepID=UPI003F6D1C34